MNTRQPNHEAIPQAVFLEKARTYCAYSERCVQDMRQKLRQWECPSQYIAPIIRQLEQENFINEERYVRTFIRSKLNQNKWGLHKILFALRQKNIPESLIQLCHSELDTDEYVQTLRELIQSKRIKEDNPYKLKVKLASYAIQKGFQAELVWNILNETTDHST